MSCPLPDLSGDVAESGDATVGLCVEGGDADLLELLGGWPLTRDGFGVLPNFEYTDFAFCAALVLGGVVSVYLSTMPLCLLFPPGTLGGGRGGGVGWNVLCSICGLCCCGISA